MDNKVFHLEAWFNGYVQGVNFRYTTTQIARQYNVSGLVKNLSDGRVWLNVEGQKREVEAFFEAIKRRMNQNIEDIQTKADYRRPNFNSFEIAY